MQFFDVQKSGKLVYNKISWMGDSVYFVEYEDSTPATEAQMGKDVVSFLSWAAEPEMEERKLVGDPVADHKCWDRPEDMTKKRPLTKISTSTPGSDVAAETAAAMASASLVFKSSNSTYSRLLLRHAEDLFTFASEHRGTYSKHIPAVRSYYNSTGYGDELLWAASWLYYATKDTTYLDFVTGEDGEDYANWGTRPWVC